MRKRSELRKYMISYKLRRRRSGEALESYLSRRTPEDFGRKRRKSLRGIEGEIFEGRMWLFVDAIWGLAKTEKLINPVLAGTPEGGGRRTPR